MTDDTRCYHRPEQPRAVVGRHLDGCDGGDCSGCQRCDTPHCLVCSKTHAHAACPACIGHTRDDLAAIEAMLDRLPDEALHSHATGKVGTGPMGGEALTLLAGWSDAYHAGHYGGPDERTSDPLPPLALLTSWVDCWRDTLGQPTDLPARVDRELAYLRDHLTDMGTTLEPPFSDFATEIRSCRAHLESVLSEGDRDDPAGVGCFDCGGQLVRRMTDAGLDDKWTCRRCDRAYSDPEYMLAVRAAIEREAS